MNDLHIQSLEVMDVYHDGQPEVFGRVLGGGNFTVIWLGYRGKSSILVHAETGQVAGGRYAWPNFVQTADLHADGVDEVVIEEQYDRSARFETYRLSHNGVKRVFQVASMAAG